MAPPPALTKACGVSESGRNHNERARFAEIAPDRTYEKGFDCGQREAATQLKSLRVQPEH
jgi:hypothetical protein